MDFQRSSSNCRNCCVECPSFCRAAGWGNPQKAQRLLGILLADRNELLFRTNSFHQIAFFKRASVILAITRASTSFFFRHGLEVFQSCGRRLEFHIGKTAVALCSSFWRESVGISVLPHIISRRFVADLIFFCCFIPCEFAVVNPTDYVQSLLFRVLHVATSCAHQRAKLSTACYPVYRILQTVSDLYPLCVQF